MGLRTVFDMADDDDPARALVGLRELREALERREAEVVKAARDAGWSWRQIARVYGLPHETLRRRYGARSG